jgi:beta-phosphoglucomutase family hydrolase
MTLAPRACAVIFDLDGVLVDSSACHYESFRRLGEEEGYTMTPELFRTIFGRRNPELFPIIYGHPLPASELDRLAERKETLFRELMRGQVRPLPGVLALVALLQAGGVHLAIGTSTPRENVTLILDELGLTDSFAVIVSAEDVSRGKPDPQVFCLAAERLGIPPARCIVVEDAVAGVQAARRGGMVAVGVTTNHPRAALSEAHRVVESLEELTLTDLMVLLTAKGKGEG